MKLREIANVRQVPGEHRRRWFESRNEELIVWFADDGSILGFQLCYDRETKERALTWRAGSGFSHEKVDDGEAVGFAYKQAPILLPDGAFDAPRVLERFTEVASAVPSDIVNFISSKLALYRNGKDT